MAKTRSKPHAESDQAPDPADPASASPDLAREAVVRLHAYRLWERRGRSDGHAMDDWLQAESELAHLGSSSRSRLSGPGAEGAR